MSDTSGDLSPSCVCCLRETLSLLRVPLVNLERRTLVDVVVVRVTFLATEIRQKQHSDWVEISITSSFDLEVFNEPNSTDRATMVAEQVAVRFTSKMPKDDDDFQLYPCFNSFPLIAGSKDDEKKLIGPRLVRWQGENYTCQTSQNLKDTN